MSRTNVSQTIKDKNKKKDKKPVNDPRPKQSDIGKKYKNYGEFRQAVLAWKKRNQPTKKRLSPYERKHGKKQPNVKTSNNLKVKKVPFAKDRVGEVDLTSSEYKQAKATNESLKINQKKKVVKKKVDKKKVENKGPNLEAANEILNKPKKEVTFKDFETKDVKKDDKKKEKKIPRGSARNFIKYKGKMLRRGTPMARKAEEAERRRKKLAAKGYMKNR